MRPRFGLLTLFAAACGPRGAATTGEGADSGPVGSLEPCGFEPVLPVTIPCEGPLEYCGGRSTGASCALPDSETADCVCLASREDFSDCSSSRECRRSPSGKLHAFCVDDGEYCGGIEPCEGVCTPIDDPEVECPIPFYRCEPDWPLCIEPSTDEYCGSCDHSCLPGETCINGWCTQ